MNIKKGEELRMAKYKTGDLVRDDCGCIMKILKVGRKNYTAINTTPILLTMEYYKGKCKKIPNRHIQEKINIKDFDKRARKEA